MDMQPARDEMGYLLDPQDWSEEIANQLAHEDDLELEDDAWTIMQFMRGYFEENHVAPDVRHVVAWLVKEHGYDKKAAKKHLFELFPHGYMQQACKVAGLIRPRAWSTG